MGRTTETRKTNKKKEAHWPMDHRPWAMGEERRKGRGERERRRGTGVGGGCRTTLFHPSHRSPSLSIPTSRLFPHGRHVFLICTLTFFVIVCCVVRVLVCVCCVSFFSLACMQGKKKKKNLTTSFPPLLFVYFFPSLFFISFPNFMF